VPNLLIIAFTMYLVRYCLFIEFVQIDGSVHVKPIDFALSGFEFFLLVFSTLLIAAAGNIINDYFDTKIDIINKPERIVIGKKISRRIAMLLHISLSTFAVLVGFYLAYRLGKFKVALINPAVVGLLWFYSTTYKRTFLIGNIIIAFLSAMVPLIVGLFEPKILEGKDFMKGIFGFVLGYSLFALIVSLIREIIKDMEDIEGDRWVNCKTLPIVMGINLTKTVVIVLSLTTMIMLGRIQFLQYMSNDKISFWYFLFALQLPFMVMIFIVIRARKKSEYHLASMVNKGIMFLGVLSMLVFYYTLTL
jgi:4-hydroxybenzoate polyprenyltransferase